MIRLLAVFERDLRRVVRNPYALAAAVLLPMLYLVILGNSLQGPVKHLRLGLVVADDGKAARDLIGALQAVEHGPRTVRLVKVDVQARGLELVRSGKLSGLLVIPERFSQEAERGVAPSLGLFLDNVESISANTLTTAIGAALRASPSPPVRLELHVGPPQLRTQEIFPRVDYDASLVPGVVVMSLFMGSLLAGAFNLVMDRFMGIHESYLSTPLRRQDIALGTLLSGTVVTCTSAVLVLALGLLITGARLQGGPWALLALAGVLLLSGLGLLAMMMALLGRAEHPRTTGVLSGFLSVILFFPSGALYPVESFPGWLRAFAVVDPETHAVAALKTLLFRGGDVQAIGVDVAFLAGFTALMLLAAVATLKRTL